MPRPLRNSLPALRAALIACAVLAVAALANHGAGASSILRLVNDEPITSFDVEQRAKFVSVTQRKGVTKSLKSEALEELTDEALKRQEAKRLGISADPSEVEARYADIAQRVKMSPAQLSKAFASVGVNVETLKRRIESDLLWRDVVRQRFRSEVRVQDQDVQQAMLAKKDEENDKKTIEFELQQVVLILPKGANASAIATRKREAEQIRTQFRSCDDMRGAIEGHRDVVYKKIGRRVIGELPEEVRGAMETLGPGTMSPPFTATNAVQMFAICDRQEVQDDSVERREVRNGMMQEQGGILARRLLIDLRQSAVIENR